MLETGIDLRIANRPMLGIAPGDFTEEQAVALGVPVREGIRLDGLVAGMGAERAGLQKDDVIVEMNGHPVKNDASSLPNAIAGRKGGETIDVVFYRGAEKKSVAMELSKRPMPEVPASPVELARQARALYEPALDELEKCFEGFTDEQAMHRPGATEWSALEVMAHLVFNERYNITLLNSLIDGYEPVTDGFGGNINAQVQAMVKANPSIRMMMDELRRTVEELLAFVELAPVEFPANKGSYHRFGSGLLQLNFHLSGHNQQIRDALASAGVKTPQKLLKSADGISPRRIFYFGVCQSAGCPLIRKDFVLLVT